MIAKADARARYGQPIAEDDHIIMLVPPMVRNEALKYQELELNCLRFTPLVYFAVNAPLAVLDADHRNAAVFADTHDISGSCHLGASA